MKNEFREFFRIFNAIRIEYLDDDVHETEQFVSDLNKQTGINPDTIVKALNLLLKQKRLITTNSQKTGKNYIRKLSL
jgi:DNA-binding transcriptional regulator YhcF (GntR family)